MGDNPVIWQRFDLDLEAMTEASEDPHHKPKVAGAGRIMKEELRRRGYIFLESDVRISGVPTSVLLGGEQGKTTN